MERLQSIITGLILNQKAMDSLWSAIQRRLGGFVLPYVLRATKDKENGKIKVEFTIDSSFPELQMIERYTEVQKEYFHNKKQLDSIVQFLALGAELSNREIESLEQDVELQTKVQQTANQLISGIARIQKGRV